MHIYLGEIIMALGVAVMIGGLVGLIRFHTFYRRLLVGSLIDTAGMLLFLLGAVIRQGLTEFSLKLVLIMAAVILTAPLVTHKLGRSAYLSGHREDAVERTETAPERAQAATERAGATVERMDTAAERAQAVVEHGEAAFAGDDISVDVLGNAGTADQDGEEAADD